MKKEAPSPKINLIRQAQIHCLNDDIYIKSRVIKIITLFSQLFLKKSSVSSEPFAAQDLCNTSFFSEVSPKGLWFFFMQSTDLKKNKRTQNRHLKTKVCSLSPIFVFKSVSSRVFLVCVPVNLSDSHQMAGTTTTLPGCLGKHLCSFSRQKEHRSD